MLSQVTEKRTYILLGSGVSVHDASCINREIADGKIWTGAYPRDEALRIANEAPATLVPVSCLEGSPCIQAQPLWQAAEEWPGELEEAWLSGQPGSPPQEPRHAS